METDFPKTWRLLPIEKCMSAIIDYRGKSPRKTSFGIPLITAKIVKGGRILHAEEFISPEDYDEWMRRGLPRAGDIVMTTEAPLGEVAQLDGKRIALAQRLITLRGKPGTLDNTYLKFTLQSQYVQAELRARATGTTVLGIRQSELRKVQLPIPPMSEQKAIAHVLGALDDKIELNRRMNETLEAMARAIFKSWFVDFDPVRAKAEGHQPFGMDAATAALFPDSFQDSPLGKTPKGWTVTSLKKEIEAIRGLSYKGSGLAETGFPLHNLNSVFEGGGYKYEGIKHYTGEYQERHIVNPGDLVVTNTEQGFDFLLIGYPAIVPKFYGKVGLFSHHLYRVRPKESSSVKTHFLYWLLMSSSVRPQIIGCANGTTVNMLATDGLERPRFPLPPAELINAFERIAAPLHLRTEANYEESVTLARLRDALLPKLISGEIRLKSAGKLVEENA